MAFIKNRAWVFLAMLLLSACLSPVKTEQTTYVINTLPPSIAKKPQHHGTLVVAQMDSNAIYNTTQMAYSTRPYQVSYFAKNSWADTPATMLQSLLIQTVQRTHYFSAVGSPSMVGHYDYVLDTQLLQFEQRFYKSSSEVVVVVRAQITKAATNRITATKQFTVIEAAPFNTPYGGVIAANRAAAKLMAQIARFVCHSPL